MILICYLNENSQKNYNIFENIDEFKSKHPDCSIEYMFNLRDEQNKIEIEQMERFNFYCRQYGFTEDDYKHPLIIENKCEGILVGFLPQNTKYKCRAYVPSENKYYKMTPKHCKELIIAYDKIYKNH